MLAMMNENLLITWKDVVEEHPEINPETAKRLVRQYSKAFAEIAVRETVIASLRAFEFEVKWEKFMETANRILDKSVSALGIVAIFVIFVIVFTK